MPPSNFAMVDGGVFRSGYPVRKNFAFLRRLGLRTVLYLCPEPYPEANLVFLRSMGAQLLQVGLNGNKDAMADDRAENANVARALVAVVDPTRWPLLIHCNKGKHRTGCVVGCLRRVQGWALTPVLEEYRRFSMPKVRFLDEQFIELFHVARVRKLTAARRRNAAAAAKEEEAEEAKRAP